MQIGVRGQVGSAIYMATDITERKRMEEDLLKLLKLESVGMHAGGIAHDFNNLLTAVAGNISLSLLYVEPQSEVSRLLRTADDACMQAKELSQRLIMFSKGGQPIKERLAIGGLLKDWVDRALSGSNISVVYDLAGDLPLVDVDPGQMKQVIINLVTNAREAIPCGGTLTVAAAHVAPMAAEKLHLEPGPYLEICLADTGTGIPGEFLKTIFDPSFSTKDFGSARGRGLGLAISHSIIRKHGGMISAASPAGKGASFHVFLPASDSGRPLALAHVASGTGTKRVLVVDDEEAMRKVVQELLEYLGYDVACTRDAEEAAVQYRKAKEGGRPFDLVILAPTTPGGLGGIESLKKLRQVDPAVRAILASGYADDPVLINFRDHGFVGAISKPFNLEQLRQALSDAMVDAPGVEMKVFSNLSFLCTLHALMCPSSHPGIP